MGGITESRPLRIGGVAVFHTNMIGGITEYRGRILRNMSIPPPVVNDMSLSFAKLLNHIKTFLGSLQTLHTLQWQYLLHSRFEIK